LGDPFEDAAKEQEKKEQGIPTEEVKEVEEIASEKPAPKVEHFKSSDDALESLSRRLAEK